LDFSSSPPASPNIPCTPVLQTEPEVMRPTTPTDWSSSQHGGQQFSPSSPSASTSSWKLRDSDNDFDAPDHGAQHSSPITVSPIQVDKSLPPAIRTKDISYAPEQIEICAPSTQNTQYTTDYPTATSVSAPTPAQRPKPSSLSCGTGTFPSSAPASLNAVDSSPISLNVAQLYKDGDRHLLASSPLVSSSYAVLAGPGKILVPNSDTSGTHSQPSQPPPSSLQQVQSGISALQALDGTVNEDMGLPEDPHQSRSPNLDLDKAKTELQPPSQPQDNPIAQSLSYKSQSQSQLQNEEEGDAKVDDIRDKGDVEILEPSQPPPPLQHVHNGMPALRAQGEMLNERTGPTEDSSQSRSPSLELERAKTQLEPLSQLQGNPVAQSLSYTSHSQSQPQNEGKGGAEVGDIKEKGESGIVETQYFEAVSELTKLDVTEEKRSGEAAIERGQHNIPPNALHVRIEEEEEQQEDELISDSEKDELDSDDEVMQAIEAEYSAAVVSPERPKDLSQDELEVDELESDDEKIANMTQEVSDLPEGLASPPIASPSAKSMRHSVRWSLEARSPPISCTPSLPSEPDVFMDEASFSTHMKHPALQHPNPHSREDLKTIVKSASAKSASISDPSHPPRRSSGVHINAEAGPSTSIPSATKLTSTSPPKPRGRFLFHDPEVWAAPSFLRGRTKNKAERPEPVVPAAAPAQSPRHHDRALKRKRSFDDATPPGSQQRPNKKPKHADTDVEAVPRKNPVPKQSALARANPERSHRDTTPATTLAKTDSLTSTVSRIRQLDLAREPSMASSISSGRKKKREKETELKITPLISVAKSTDREHVSIPCASKAVESNSRSNDSAVQGKQREEPMARRLKLGGFKPKLEFSLSDNPGLITWQVLSETLLAVRQRRENAG
jgi:hypothetical protein